MATSGNVMMDKTIRYVKKFLTRVLGADHLQGFVAKGLSASI